MRFFRKIFKIIKENTKEFILYLVKDIIYLVSMWQLDIVAASIIAYFYSIVKNWILYLPVGISKEFPFIIIGWEATAWSFPDAYVRFLFLMSFSFFLPEMYIILKFINQYKNQ